MMATFRKRYGKWQVRIQRQFQPSLSKTFDKLSDAKIWGREQERILDLGLQIAQPKIQLSILLIRYRDEILPSKKNTRPDYYRINQILKFPISKYALQDLRSQHIVQFRDQLVSLKKSANTIRLYLAIVSHLYTIAINEWGYENLNNPVSKIRRPKLPPSRDFRLNDQQIMKIIHHTQSPLLPDLILIALHSAMRCSEIVNLEWQDIDYEKKQIHVKNTKNNHNRFVPMNDELINLFRKQPLADSKIFPITSHAVGVAFRRACIRAEELGVCFHTLRHESISRMFEKGLDIPKVSLISGHMNWLILKRYAHIKII